MTILRLPRKFRVGATLLPDIDPDAPPLSVVQAYSRTYPALLQATIDPHPVEENGELVFKVSLPEVQTKGAKARNATARSVRKEPAVAAMDSDTAAALQDLDDWEKRAAEVPSTTQAVQRMASHLEVMRQRPLGDVDPFLLPMA